jgi:Cu+-exporting ATPase
MNDDERCHVEPAPRPSIDARTLEDAASVMFAVSDLGCANCANRVRNAFLSVDGVLDADVDLPSRTATVAYDGGRVNVDDLVGALEAAGEGTRHAYRAVVLDRTPTEAARGEVKEG